jgi:hypothetical protein
MPGFLDPQAPSVDAEYSRYLEGDVLGKIIFKNFLLNAIGLHEESICIPISRYGDIKADRRPKADALIREGGNWLDVEIKCARINIANKTLGYTRANWAFSNILKSPGKESKQYDMLFAVGIEIMGHEHPDYWRYLALVKAARSKSGIIINMDAKPHEPEYLSLCSFFILPFHQIQHNCFRVMVDQVSRCYLRPHHSWGFEQERLVALWKSCVEQACCQQEKG